MYLEIFDDLSTLLNNDGLTKKLKLIDKLITLKRYKDAYFKLAVILEYINVLFVNRVLKINLNNSKVITFCNIYLNYDEKLANKMIAINAEYNLVSSLEFLNNAFLNQVATKNDITLGFSNPKPSSLLKKIVEISTSKNDIILDFFAGSGTTAQAVMELNKEDGGNRKFILVQLDEEILKDKPAYDFIIENDLMNKRQDNDKKPYISDITIERCNRAGEKILKELDNKSEIDVGYKVFSLVDKNRIIESDNGQLEMQFLENKMAIDTVYNMIFKVGIDDPSSSSLIEITKDCIYKANNNYYITNSYKIEKDKLKVAIDDNAQIFIDGWTATINTTLQQYGRSNVKIVL